MTVKRRWRLIPVRSVGRRADDVRRARAARDRSVLLPLALSAVLLWAVIASVGFVSELEQRQTDAAALLRASHALTLARSALANDARALSESVQAKQLAEAIAQERAQSIRSNCVAQDQRNRVTRARLRMLEHRPAASEVRQVKAFFRLLGVRGHLAGLVRFVRAQTRASEAGTVSLIDALAPYRNCRALTRSETTR